MTYKASSPSPVSEPATSEPRTYEPPLPLASGDAQPTSRGPFFAVHGVERDDVLNVRAQPGPQSPVVGELPPGTTGIIATGARQRVGPGIWREVTYGNIRGWVNERFLIEERGAESTRRSDARSGGSSARR